MNKQNCWEFKRCGRQPGGAHAAEFGVCPASTEKRLNGVHGGRNAGRACWVVAGTFCRGEVQGEFAKKFRSCRNCEFYLKVKEEEGVDFILSPLLLAKLRD
jgi:hypothetical protein